MPITRRDLLALCSALCLAPLRPSGAAPAQHPLLDLRDIEFITITTRISVPRLGNRLVLNPGDRFGLGWYGDRGAPLAVLLIQRLGEDVLHALPHVFSDSRIQP